jgi:hypothetical protein
MKNILPFQLFEASTSLTEDQIKWLNSCTEGSWKLNPSTGLIDVDGDFDCNRQNLTDFKGVRFGHVNGYFYCYHNQLTSLVGAPQKVGGDFYCDNNQLTSLEGAPQKVGDGFYCHNNQLTSLEEAPQKVERDFYCNGNQLTSLEGAPLTVGNFICNDNPVSEKTLSSIFSLMKKGKSYQQALEEFWPEIDDNDDRILMYKDLKDHSSLTPEEIRRYDALTTVNRIKNYL